MKKKLAFSIIEAMIALTILSIVIASSAQFLSKKTTNVAIAGVDASHGRFECWKDKSGNVNQALYVGDKLVGEIKRNVGECKFTPPTNAVKLNVIAVGAGGAGGGIGTSFIDSFKDETKTGVFNVMKDKEKPEVPVYTTKLGSTTQTATTSTYESWFKYDLFNGHKNANAFDIFVVGCAGKGGTGGGWTINNRADLDCIRGCLTTNYSHSCVSSGNCPWEREETVQSGGSDNKCNGNINCNCNSDHKDENGQTVRWCSWPTVTETVSGSEYCCFQNKCSGAKCDKSYYKCTSTHDLKEYNKTKDGYCKSGAEYSSTACISATTGCETITKERTSTAYPQKFLGCEGGAAPEPPCVYIAKNISEKTTASRTCFGSGANGRSVTKTIGDKSETSVSEGFSDGTTDGMIGKSCVIKMNNKVTGYAIGGLGGTRFIQPQVYATFTKEYDNGGNELAEQIGNEFLSVFTAPQNANDGHVGDGFETDYSKGIVSGYYKIMGKYRISTQEESGKVFYNLLNDTLCPIDSCTNPVTDSCIKGTKGTTSFSVASGITNGNEYWWGTKGKSDSKHYSKDANENKKPNKTKGKVHGNGGTYNHKYSWTDPRGSKFLGYGEAGQPGQFIQTTIETKNEIRITPGTGGQADSKNWNKMTDQKRSGSGSDTIIKYGISSLVAKGGQGGVGNFTTERYELCHVLDVKEGDAPDECKEVRSSKQIENSNEKPSQFAQIYSAFGNTQDLIKSNLGYGGQGAESVSEHDIMHGIRSIINVSAHSKDKKQGESYLTIYKEGEDKYPSDFTCKTTTNSSNIVNTACVDNYEKAIENCETNFNATYETCETQECQIKATSALDTCKATAEAAFETCTSNHSGNVNLPTEACLKEYYKNSIKTQSVTELQGGHGGVVITW